MVKCCSIDRIKLNKYIDIVMGILFIPLVLSSTAMYLLPEAQGIFLGLPMKMWITMHGKIGWAFIGLIIAHLVLHFKILKSWAKFK